MEGLKSSAGFIRRKLAENVNLRNTPEMTFILDQSIEYGVRMSRMIDEVAGHSGRDVYKRQVLCSVCGGAGAERLRAVYAAAYFPHLRGSETADKISVLEKI